MGGNNGFLLQDKNMMHYNFYLLIETHYFQFVRLSVEHKKMLDE